jgi:hypothetical protein
MRCSVFVLGLFVSVLQAFTAEVGTAGFSCNKPFCAN